MGTNYYAIKKKPSLYSSIIHIGKSSFGWKFLFRGYLDEGEECLNIKSLNDWKKYLDNDELIILNEYDQEISYNDFFDMIEKKQLENNIDDFTYSVNVGGYRFNFRDFG